MTTLTNDEKFTASFVFYYSFADMISKIPDREIRLQAYEMLFEYALFGTEPQIEHWAVDMVFSAVKPQIDANNKRRKNGKKAAESPPRRKRHRHRHNQKQRRGHKLKRQHRRK